MSTTSKAPSTARPKWTPKAEAKGSTQSVAAAAVVAAAEEATRKKKKAKLTLVDSSERPSSYAGGSAAASEPLPPWKKIDPPPEAQLPDLSPEEEGVWPPEEEDEPTATRKRVVPRGSVLSQGRPPKEPPGTRPSTRRWLMV